MASEKDDLWEVRDAAERWTQSDVSYVRVLEDLINVLIAKNVISMDDLPPDVQRNTQERQQMRDWMARMIDVNEKVKF